VDGEDPFKAQAKKLHIRDTMEIERATTVTRAGRASETTASAR
jgi:hypothetical protein